MPGRLRCAGGEQRESVREIVGWTVTIPKARGATVARRKRAKRAAKYLPGRCRLCRESVPPVQIKDGLCDRCRRDPATVWLKRHDKT